MVLWGHESIFIQKETNGSNGNGHRAWEKAEWMVCHFDYEHLPQELLLAMYKFIELER